MQVLLIDLRIVSNWHKEDPSELDKHIDDITGPEVQARKLCLHRHKFLQFSESYSMVERPTITVGNGNHWGSHQPQHYYNNVLERFSRFAKTSGLHATFHYAFKRSGFSRKILSDSTSGTAVNTKDCVP
ncbi:unnamed protein product [Hermetia illucens]|uniref:Uncharacterized protein n=1 Tax=Hermetia illucens TaxID=343691 RepID=A0A7R8YUT8_HERIL|nr:unnamed protein product [Hermetia illucens]